MQPEPQILEWWFGSGRVPAQRGALRGGLGGDMGLFLQFLTLGGAGNN